MLRRFAVVAVFCLFSSCAAVSQQVSPLFGGELVVSKTGDPVLQFQNVKKGSRTLDGGTVRLVWFEGEPALLTRAGNEHWASSSRSYGVLLICKNRAIFNVEDGSGAKGYSKALPEDNIEVPISALELTYHDDLWNGTKTLATLREPSRKRGLYLLGVNRSFYEFIVESVKDFDGVVNAIAQTAKLTDMEHNLSASAHYHRTGSAELEQHVEQRKQEQKAEEAAEKANHKGGGGLDTLLAITTGVAEGLSTSGNNTPILQAGNQQAAAIRAIGDRNATIQAQAAQARAQQAAQANLARELAAQQAAAQLTRPPAQPPAQQNANVSVGNATASGECGGAGVGDTLPPAPRALPRSASSCVSVTVINKSQGYVGDYLLTNNCGEYVNVAFSTAAHPTGSDTSSLFAGDKHDALYADSAYRIWACTNEAVPIDTRTCAAPTYNSTSVSCQ